MRGGADDRHVECRELRAKGGEKAFAVGRETPLLAQPPQELGLAVGGRRR